LVLHGADDPVVPDDQTLSFWKEMREATANWQFVAYGRALHTFTNWFIPEDGPLDAIAALRIDASVRPPTVTADPARPLAGTPTAAPVAEALGERRHLTVMFCDLVGSTSISARLDAEDWRDLVGSYLDVASAAVTEMGGHVAKKLGDGLMALFAYPVAQENDAERAARAALSIQRALADINRKNASSSKPALNARISVCQARAPGRHTFWGAFPRSGQRSDCPLP
jgi:class 3 adenylate cyclase